MPTTASCRIPAVALALLAAASLAPGLRADDGRVAIAAPRHLATVLGTTDIVLSVTPPAGASVVRVEIQVDGLPLATIERPPWAASFEAGEGQRGHRIEALAVFSDGTSARAVARTSPLRIQESVAVDLVNLYPLVYDPSGNYVPDLTRDDFVVLEDGRPQKIERFSNEPRPLRIALVLDTSLTMSRNRKLDHAREAALEFLDVLRPADEALVVSFSDDVRLLQDATSDRTALAQAISGVEAAGGTALYDALWRTAKRLTEFDGRRVLVLLSDGRDEAANGFEPGSLHTLDEAIDQALRDEVMVFAVGLGKDLDRQFAREWTRPSTAGFAGESELSQKQVLGSMAERTGGRLLLSPGPSRLRRAFQEIEADLRHQYSIAYEPEDRARPGFRRIEVTVPGRSVVVVAKEGYYADED